MFILNPYRHVAAGGGGSLPASTAMDLRAGSYSSGQTWADESTTAYDMYRGLDGSASTDDPTFNSGSPAYWGFDGGDAFTIAGGNTTLTNALHRGTQDYWMCCVLGSSATNQTFIFMGTGLDTSESGMRWAHSSSTGSLLQVRQSGTLVFNEGIGSPIPTSSDVCIILSVELGTAINVYVNGSKSTYSGSNYSSTEAVDASDLFGVAGILASGQSLPFKSDMTLYAASMGSSSLTDEEAADIKSFYESELGLSFS